MLPGIERQPRKKLEPSPERLLALLHRWRDEAIGAGKEITRIALAFEAGRDGFWLARWLRARGVEAHVIHPSSVAGIARTSPSEDRPARHRVTEAGVLGVAAWGTGATAPWRASRRLPKRTPSGPIASASAWSGNARAIVNRLKGTLARLGIRNFKPSLRKAPARLATLHTPEGSALPPNVSPSCSAIWRAWASSSARSRRSRGLVRNDWSRARDRTTRHGTAPGSGRRHRRRNG